MTIEQKEPALGILKWVALTFLIVTVLITLVFFAWWGMRERFVFDDQPFSQVRWMAPHSENSPLCDRGDMVRDLKNRLLKQGMGKNQVTMLLGRPDWEEPHQLEYELGICLWVVHGLRLYFNDQDHLISTAIIQH